MWSSPQHNSWWALKHTVAFFCGHFSNTSLRRTHKDLLKTSIFRSFRSFFCMHSWWLDEFLLMHSVKSAFNIIKDYYTLVCCKNHNFIINNNNNKWVCFASCITTLYIFCSNFYFMFIKIICSDILILTLCIFI